jgi:hypothetical protein
VTAGYHFSIDDVFDSLFDVDAPLWAFLDEAHARFGVPADLYVFLTGGGRSLADVPPHALAARPWLRIGPHARDLATPPHAEDAAARAATFAALYAAIDRAVGRARRSTWVRLHYFSEPYESAAQLVAEGARTLLLTDRDAIAYRLPDAAKSELEATGRITHAGLKLRRSHVRLEDVLARGEPPEPLLDRALARHGYVTMFTHEPDLAHPELRALAMRCFAHLAERGVPAIE